MRLCRRWSGTFFILLIYAAAMLPGALVAPFVTRWPRWLLPAAGALFLCVPAVGVGHAGARRSTGMSTVQWVGAAVAAVGVFVTIGFAAWATVRLVDRLMGRSAKDAFCPRKDMGPGVP